MTHYSTPSENSNNYTFVKQGRLWKCYRASRKADRGLLTRKVDWKRREITSFSYASRRRLMRKLAAFGRQFGVFITLTQRGDATFDNLRAFIAAFNRRWPNHPIIWKKEKQKRGTVHYHLIIWGIKFVPHAWIKKTWAKIVGQDDLAVCRCDYMPKGSRKIQAYISKYVAKVEAEAPAGDEDAHPGEAGYLDSSSITAQSEGRYWGIYNRDCIVYAPINVIMQPSEGKFRLITALFDYCKAEFGVKPRYVTWVSFDFDD